LHGAKVIFYLIYPKKEMVFRKYLKKVGNKFSTERFLLYISEKINRLCRQKLRLRQKIKKQPQKK
jgi:hypothetical protein